jgi:hypothetical protein
VRGDGSRGQEQAVGDLAVGEAVAGEDRDLALLRGEGVQGIRRGQPCSGRDAARAQLRLGAPCPRGSAEAAEGVEGCSQDRLRVVDPPLPP